MVARAHKLGTCIPTFMHQNQCKISRFKKLYLLVSVTINLIKSSSTNNLKHSNAVYFLVGSSPVIPDSPANSIDWIFSFETASLHWRWRFDLTDSSYQLQTRKMVDTKMRTITTTSSSGLVTSELHSSKCSCLSLGSNSEVMDSLSSIGSWGELVLGAL